MHGAEIPADIRADAGQSVHWGQFEQSAAGADRVKTYSNCDNMRITNFIIYNKLTLPSTPYMRVFELW